MWYFRLVMATLVLNFKIFIVSMKKIYTDSQRNHFNRKQQHHSPTHFPKKQFQFIYRQKDNLPSSEAYESIIFMRSKKCQAKQTPVASKVGSKNKKHSVDAIKKRITEIEKQIKQEQSNRNKKQEDALKATILKSKVNVMAESKKEGATSRNKNKASQRWNKYQKGEILSCENVKKYKNVLSPSRHIKEKSEQATAYSQFAKTTQEAFGKDIKSKDKKKNKKQNSDPLNPPLNFGEPEEYVLLENNFVQLSVKDVSILDGKLLSSRDFPIDKQASSYYLQRRSYEVNEPIMEDNQTQKDFQQYLQFEGSDQSSRMNNSVSSSHQNFAQSNISVVQSYLINKVTIIQRWWRKIMKKQRFNEDRIFFGRIQQNSNKDDFNESEQSFVFGEKMPDATQIVSSPIKMIDQFKGAFQHSTGQMNGIISRENAAKLQMQTHRSILEKLLISKKINPDTYIQRKEMIETKYYSQLQQIQELKRMLRSNASKAAEIEKKALQDLKMIEQSDLQVDNSLLDKIFGNEDKDIRQNNHKLAQIPVLHNNKMVYNRQKSTGCHFNSEQKVKTSLYKKQQLADDGYQQDFEDLEQENEGNSIQCKQFGGQNSPVGSCPNSNIRELFDQFKLREQAKMEIDKRAAIQMGVIVEDIPPELKDQFVGIDTSLNSIHRLLLAFFKYYIFYYKYDFLRLINMPYGFNIDKKVKILQGYADDQDPEEDEDGVIYGLKSVIPQDIFEEFYEKVYDIGNGKISSAKIANFQFGKIHNRAIFDCFNQSLNYFRPYYLIDGPPFPWNHSQKALTFYFIAQQNIQQVFEKTQFKVLKWASILSGIIVNKLSGPSPPIEKGESAQQILEIYRQINNPLLNQTRQDRLNKNEKVQIEETNYEWTVFEDQKTVECILSSDFAFDQLIQEICLEVFLSNQIKQGQQQQENEPKAEFECFQHMSESSSLSEFQLC